MQNKGVLFHLHGLAIDVPSQQRLPQTPLLLEQHAIFSFLGFFSFGSFLLHGCTIGVPSQQRSPQIPLLLEQQGILFFLAIAE